jgi:hypothetical protein
MLKENVKIRKASLVNQGNSDDVTKATPADRIAMVWLLTLNVWTFKEGGLAELRVQKHIVRVHRKKS